MTNLVDIYSYYKDRIDEVKKFANSGPGDLWAFLMCATFIDFLVKMVNGKEDSRAIDYKNFIRDYLSKVDIRYQDFEYRTGNKKDLPEQMYHILRCGMVHSYSLVPDSQSKKHGGRSRSIVLGQRRNKVVHFTRYDLNNQDAVIFTVEDFAEDLEKVLYRIFKEDAPKNPKLESDIISWIKKYPPIMAMPI